jgi:DNA polymerase V
VPGGLDNFTLLSETVLPSPDFIGDYMSTYPLSKQSAEKPKPESEVDLHKMLVPDPDSAFLLRVEGEGMSLAGIEHGDLLVIDSSRVAMPGDIVVLEYYGTHYVRRFRETPTDLLFTSESAESEVLEMGNSGSVKILGVVLHSIRSFERE